MEMGDIFFLKLPLARPHSIIKLRRVFANLAKIGYFNSLQEISKVRQLIHCSLYIADQRKVYSMLRNCTTFNGSWLLHCNATCIDISKWVCQLLFHLKCKRRTSKGVYQSAKQSNFFFAKTLISAASSSYVEEVDKSLLKLKICSSVPADSVKKHSVIEFLLPKFLARDAEIR